MALLNDCTEPASWPLGKGDEIVARIGSHKPNLFAVMDLTTGYHQAAMSLSARVFTAIITYILAYTNSNDFLSARKEPHLIFKK
jgi:hypothetical protein